MNVKEKIYLVIYTTGAILLLIGELSKLKLLTELGILSILLSGVWFILIAIKEYKEVK